MTSLRTRLLVAVGLVVLAALATVSLAVRQSARREFLQFQENERHSEAARHAVTTETVARELDGTCCSSESMEKAARRLDADGALFVFDASGRPLEASAGPALRGAREVLAKYESNVLLLGLSKNDSRGGVNRVTLQFAVNGTPIALADGRRGLVFVVSVPLHDVPATKFLVALDLRLFWATILVGVAALAGTWFVARSAVRPIAELRAATVDLARGRLSRRVRTDGPEEVAALATSFNEMAAELERQQALRQSLVHDVAHELRTPLTALQCRLETAIDGLSADPIGSLTDLHEQVRHLSKLVDDLQDLALAEARELRLQPESVRISDLVASALRATGLEQDPRVDESWRRGFSPAIADDLCVQADVVRTRQVLINLLTNAARHTSPDGRITIDAREAGAETTITVHNTGSSLDPEQLQRMFDRFYRVDPSRERGTGGTGLGLAIVKHLVEAQGGRVWAASDSSGVTVGFVLPRDMRT
jgi:signal transduction histidine kinase